MTTWSSKWIWIEAVSEYTSTNMINTDSDIALRSDIPITELQPQSNAHTCSYLFSVLLFFSLINLIFNFLDSNPSRITFSFLVLSSFFSPSSQQRPLSFYHQTNSRTHSLLFILFHPFYHKMSGYTLSASLQTSFYSNLIVTKPGLSRVNQFKCMYHYR